MGYNFHLPISRAGLVSTVITSLQNFFSSNARTNLENKNTAYMIHIVDNTAHTAKTSSNTVASCLLDEASQHVELSPALVACPGVEHLNLHLYASEGA